MKKGKWLVPIMLIATICAFAAACGGNKHTHTYGEAWEITAEPTETTGGKAKHVCTGCNEAEEVDIPALSDATVWTEEENVVGTHTTEGHKKYSSIYGAVTIITPKVHTPGTDWTFVTMPTKEAEGTIKVKCTGCEEFVVEQIAPVSDTSVWRSAGGWKPASCKETGDEKYIPVNETKYGSRVLIAIIVIDKIPHEYGAWVYTQGETVTATRKCDICLEEDSHELPALSDSTFWNHTTITADYNTAGYDIYTSVDYGTIKNKTADKLQTAYDEKEYYTLEYAYSENKENGANTVTSWNGTAMSIAKDTNKVAQGGFPYNGDTNFIMNAQYGAFIIRNGTDEYNAYISADGNIIVYVRGDRVFVSITDKTSVGSGFKADDTKMCASAWQLDGTTYTALSYMGANGQKFFVEKNVIFANVTFTDISGAEIADVSTLRNCACVYVKQDGNIIGRFGKNGSTMVALDGYEGTYTKGSSSEQDLDTLVVSGFGTVSNGTYVIAPNGESYTLGVYIAGEFYEVTLRNDGTYTATLPRVNIVYNMNGGTGATNGEYTINVPITLPELTREGYVFRGWFTDSECKKAVVLNDAQQYVPTKADAVEGNITLFALWRAAKEVTVVTFVNEPNEEVITKLTLGVGDVLLGYLAQTLQLNEENIDTEKMLHFVGWFTDEARTMPLGRTVTVPAAGTVKVYAKWEEVPVYYGTYYGREVGSSSYVGNTIIHIDISFTGVISGDYNGMIQSYNKETGEIKWSNTNGVNGSFWFDAASGTFALPKDNAEKLEDAYYLFNKYLASDFAKTSFTVFGLCVGETKDTIPSKYNVHFISIKKSDNELTYLMRYENLLLSEFTSYNADKMTEIVFLNSKWVKAFVVKQSETVILAARAIPTSSNQTPNFNSQSKAQIMDQYFGTYNGENNSTVSLNGIGVIEYKYKEGSSTKSKTGTYAKETASQTYFDVYFTDNSTNAVEYYALDIQGSAYENTAKTFTLTQPKITVTYVSKGETVKTEQVNKNMVFERAVLQHTVTERFKGWFIDNNTFAQEAHEGFVSSTDITLYAKWVEAVTVTTDFNYTGAPTAEQIPLAKGDSVEIDIPLREDKIFAGWFTDAACTEGKEWISGETIVNANITIYAKWDNIPPYVNVYGFIRLGTSDSLTEWATRTIDIGINGPATGGIYPWNGSSSSVEYNGGNTITIVMGTTRRTGYIDTQTGMMVLNMNTATTNFNDCFLLSPYGAFGKSAISISSWNSGTTRAVTLIYNDNGKKSVSIFIHNAVVYFGVTFEDNSGAPVAAADCAANTATLVVKDASGTPIDFAA